MEWATRFAAGLYSASLSRVFAPALRVTIRCRGSDTQAGFARLTQKARRRPA